jgi:hypothetical protein
MSHRPANVSRETLCGPDDHTPMGLLAKALRNDTIDGCDGVVDDLALGRSHRLELVLLTGPDDLLHSGADDRDQLLALARSEAVDVEQQAHAPSRLAEDGEAGQLLKGLERLAPGSDEHVQVRAFEVDVASGLVHPGGDVAVDIQGIKEALKEVARSLRVHLHHLRLDWFVAVGTA